MSNVAPQTPFFVSDEDPPSKIEVLKAALRLFVIQSRGATTIRDIAAESGYTNPALFKYFRSKDELATVLFARCYEHLSDRLHASVAAHTTFSARIAAFVETFTSMLDRPHEAEALLYIQESLRDLWPAVQRKLQRKSIVGLLARVVDDGRRDHVVATDIEPRIVVAGILGILAQFARQHYFEDIPGAAKRWAPSLQKAVERMSAAPGSAR